MVQRCQTRNRVNPYILIYITWDNPNVRPAPLQWLGGSRFTAQRIYNVDAPNLIEAFIAKERYSNCSPK